LRNVVNTNVIISLVISLFVGGAVGAGVTHFVQPTPAPAPAQPCVAAPAPQAHSSFDVPPLDYKGKTYR